MSASQVCAQGFVFLSSGFKCNILSLFLQVRYPEKNQTPKFLLVYVTPQWTLSGAHLPLMTPLETQCLYLSVPRPMPP